MYALSERRTEIGIADDRQAKRGATLGDRGRTHPLVYIGELREHLVDEVAGDRRVQWKV
jgi:hypothetical protein